LKLLVPALAVIGLLGCGGRPTSVAPPAATPETPSVTAPATSVAPATPAVTTPAAPSAAEGCAYETQNSEGPLTLLIVGAAPQVCQQEASKTPGDHPVPAPPDAPVCTYRQIDQHLPDGSVIHGSGLVFRETAGQGPSPKQGTGGEGQLGLSGPEGWAPQSGNSGDRRPYTVEGPRGRSTVHGGRRPLQTITPDSPSSSLARVELGRRLAEGSVC
jgi:hypothetical protein